MYWNIEAGPWPVNVVIMAGGKGTRLKPLTDNTHKSLIPVAGKPIVRHMIDHLAASGFREIHISVGHLAEQVMDYLGDGKELGISIRYIKERIVMGSMGALTLKQRWQHEHFLVINGDVYSNFDIRNLCFEYFTKNAAMAILTVPNSMKVPYGVVEIGPDGHITLFEEKPEYELMVNAGVYIFNQKVHNLMPKSIAFEGWHLIQAALHAGLQVAGVPHTKGYWIDIGSMETLRKAQEMSQIDIPQQ
ncbi:NTP transferase domain-containing protein [Dyadobacter sp. CY261]|uniref:nucleotidyltransferase family protein n=1 Tax=Dyadobacter sp. CY261 TaxID=2907203 RepID=UPI001F18BCF0|nr:sugar phosphate nucleotidyltransferase [Dyadobacter sp. CY261]MCF0073073.1 NTP transferase domain-containing protein [Dyadobacter sp. CY261]